MRTTGKAFTLAAVVALADWATKRWALANLHPGHPEELVGESVRLSLALNRGMLFGVGGSAGGSGWPERFPSPPSSVSRG